MIADAVDLDSFRTRIRGDVNAAALTHGKFFAATKTSSSIAQIRAIGFSTLALSMPTKAMLPA